MTKTQLPISAAEHITETLLGKKTVSRLKSSPSIIGEAFFTKQALKAVKARDTDKEKKN